MPVVVVTGARQTGKTTLVRELAPGPTRRYVTFDDYDVLAQADADPDSLFAGGTPLIIDEVQRRPAVLHALKKAVDRNREPGMVVLTGSANLLLMQNVSESLAGRASYLELPPFCPVEWAGTRDLGALDALFGDVFDESMWPHLGGDWRACLLSGGYPAALQAGSDRDVWFGGYVQAYLERDLRHLSAVSSLPDFQRLMRLAAQRTGHTLNQSELARDAGLKQATAHRYLNLLETGCQVVRLPPYTANPSVGLVKARKLFWTDSGLAAYLAGIADTTMLGSRTDTGFWFEQAVFQTFQTWRSLDPMRRRLYYWRDRKGNEVDFVLEQGDSIVAVEAKSADRARQEDLNGIRAFTDSLGKRRSLLKRSVVLHAGAGCAAMGNNSWALGTGWIFAG